MEQRYYKYEEIITTPLYRRIAKGAVKEIIKIAEKRLNKKSKELTVLDVGCGVGLYSQELAKYVKKVVGVEPFYEAFLVAKRQKSKKVQFYNSKIEDFKTKDRFDLILCLTTLEHMPEAGKSFKRIFELMKDGGLIYLTAPNKLWPFESHYGLPFLSWLPLPLANFYLKITRKGESYEDCSYSKTYFGIKKIFDKFPCRYEFYIPNPRSVYFGCGEKNKVYHLIKRVGISLLCKFPLLWIFSKGFILLIQKTSGK